MKEDGIILDTGSNIGIMSNPDMVTYIEKSAIELDFSKKCGNNTCNTKSKEK